MKHCVWWTISEVIGTVWNTASPTHDEPNFNNGGPIYNPKYLCDAARPSLLLVFDVSTGSPNKQHFISLKYSCMGFL